MHIFLFAFRSHDVKDYKIFYYTDLFHDNFGVLLNVESIRSNFNWRLMGVYYKVCVNSLFPLFNNFLLHLFVQIVYLTMIAKRIFPSAETLIKAVKGSIEAPALEKFKALAAKHVDEVSLYIIASIDNVDKRKNNVKVFPLQDRAISEANLTLLLVLVTSMNQYEAPALIDGDAISERRMFKRRRNSHEGKSVVSY